MKFFKIRLSPMQYLKLDPVIRSKLQVKFHTPKLGSRSFGYFEVIRTS